MTIPTPELCFWVLGCPNVKNSVIEDRAKVIYGDDEVPLNYEYDKETGTYTDKRFASVLGRRGFGFDDPSGWQSAA